MCNRCSFFKTVISKKAKKVSWRVSERFFKNKIIYRRMCMNEMKR